jgi:hypothetical protein
MLFNDLLAEQNIDPAGVLVLRHTPSAEVDGNLRKRLPWLADERPEIFNAYQSTQPVKVEADMLKATHVASFIGLEKRKGGTEQTAVFVGLYKKADDHRPLTFEQFWAMPAYQELKTYGMRGFVEGDRVSVRWFDLTLTDFYQKWKGKLIIEWPRPPIKWSRFANRAEFPITAILEDSLLHQAMPDWKDLVPSWADLSTLPSKWREALRHWRGIYYIFDTSDRKGYVGSAYGADNILGRWQHYAASGHGGNVLLRERSPENFIFSILQIVSHDTEPDEVITLEGTWKKRLHTMSASGGLNEN